MLPLQAPIGRIDKPDHIVFSGSRSLLQYDRNAAVGASLPWRTGLVFKPFSEYYGCVASLIVPLTIRRRSLVVLSLAGIRSIGSLAGVVLERGETIIRKKYMRLSMLALLRVTTTAMMKV